MKRRRRRTASPLGQLGFLWFSLQHVNDHAAEGASFCHMVRTSARYRYNAYSTIIHNNNNKQHSYFASRAMGTRRMGSSVDADISEEEKRSGLLVLLTVPFAWGTFEPATRYVYTVDPPIPAFVFSLSFYLVAASALALAATSAARDEADKARTATTLGQEQEGQHQPRDAAQWPIRGGLELGGYLFLGNALQVIGLQTTPAGRAAFLLQLTTIFVPLLEAFLSRNLMAVEIKTWFACVVALAGVAIMGLDSGNTKDGTAVSLLSSFEPSSLMDGFSSSLQEGNLLSSGDALVVAAAVAYSFHCIRLEGFAKQTSAVKLAASKAVTETLLSAFVLVGLVFYSSQSSTTTVPASHGMLADFCQKSGTEIVSFLDSLPATLSSSSSDSLLLAGLATVWTGLVTVAYTIYAQSYGQSRVRPVTANLIYTIQPLCTALIAWIVLGESLGPFGYVGGALLGSAVLLVTVPNKQ